MAEHKQHLTTLFDCLEKFGLVDNPAKCLFAVPQLKFLGHHITTTSSSPTCEKVDAVSNFPMPSTVGDLLMFIGMIQFYNKYIPCVILTLTPLFVEIAGKKKQVELYWTSALQ